MRFTILMKAFRPSVGPWDAPVVCQARILFFPTAQGAGHASELGGLLAGEVGDEGIEPAADDSGLAPERVELAQAFLGVVGGGLTGRAPGVEQAA
jgi:hypothetical protein